MSAADHVDAPVTGAGPGGIATTVQLHEIRLTDFVACEKAPEIGPR